MEALVSVELVTPGIAEMTAADSTRILNSVVERLVGTPEQLGGLGQPCGQSQRRPGCPP